MAAELKEIVQAYPERRRRRSLGSKIRRVLRGARWRLALGLIGSAFRVAKAGGRTYQPVEIGGKRFANVRDTDERWQAVSQVLRDYETRNVLDIGCAEGWFVRRAAAECNCFAIGIEATDTAIVGELARLHDRVQRAATVRAFMTPEAIRSLPQFDAVLCLSVLHHVIRAFGIAAAEQFLRALSARVGKVLIFEIGTADESSWTPFLPEASQGQAGQESFVRELLQRCGFRNVRVIAESAAYHREVQRLLFIAEPVQTARQDVRESLQVA
jgi:SAM-dependent methyltransferase